MFSLFAAIGILAAIDTATQHRASVTESELPKNDSAPTEPLKCF